MTPEPAIAIEASLKLDLGCGPNKQAGFIGVDALAFDGKVDVVQDLRQPWPWADGTVEEIHCSHFLEHLTGAERVHFFNELYRVMKPGAKGQVIVPHWSSSRAYGDVTHQWPPVVEMFWSYLNAEWRAANAPHVGFACNFIATWGYSVAGAWQARNQEAQMFALTHYREVAQDMIVSIVKA